MRPHPGWAVQNEGVSLREFTPSPHSWILQPLCKGRGSGDWLLGAMGRDAPEVGGERTRQRWHLGAGHEDTPSVAFAPGVLVPKPASSLRFSLGLSSPLDTAPSLP